jgi:hypothetical protein
MGEILIRHSSIYEKVFEQGETGCKRFPLWPGEEERPDGGYMEITHDPNQAAAIVHVVFNAEVSRNYELYPGPQFAQGNEPAGAIALGGQYFLHRVDSEVISQEVEI